MAKEYGSLTIYTIGHSNVTADTIIDLLNEHGIGMLVDVRSSPYSRYSPQFNREQLARALDKAGIEYAFAGAHLGGRPKDPTCYKDGTLPEGKADFLSLVDYGEVAKRRWFQDAITRLLELAGEHRTAIMCSEEDPDHCHRHYLIAQTLLEMDVTVLHIRGDGSLEAAKPEAQQLSLF